MEGRSNSGQSLNLMELLIMCGVFAVITAIWLSVFVRAVISSRNMEEENQALTALSIVAEAVRTEDVQLMSHYGITFTPGNDIPTTPIYDGRGFEELGIMVGVSYHLEDETMWYATVTVEYGSNNRMSVEVAGQKGGYHAE